MNNEYYLPGLNAINSVNRELSFIEDFKRLDKCSLFYNDSNSFYDKYFNTLNDFNLREKRFLEFETPNRALITHEYDVKVDAQFDYDRYYYLFNPIQRLSWLKIIQNEKHISIAKEDEVKAILYAELKSELGTLDEPESKFDELWANKNGLPCFIKLEDMTVSNFLISASYYDSLSIMATGSNTLDCFNWIKRFFLPIAEREVEYDYYPLCGRSSWLYIKSPSGFNVTYSIDQTICNKNYNNIDYSNFNSENRTPDPDKLALTIKNFKSGSTVDIIVKIRFRIVMPESLKYWFMAIYYLSFGMAVILLFNLINKIYLSVFQLQPLFDYNYLGEIPKNPRSDGLILTIIAAIITTRGWMISEETILKYYSKNITIILAIIIVAYLILLHL